MDYLYDEIYEMIFSYLYFKDIFKISKCNKTLNDVVKKYYDYKLPFYYNFISEKVKYNMTNNTYLLSNCNITYPEINRCITDRKLSSFISSEKLQNGIYYFSENIWKKSRSTNTYDFEYINQIEYNRYLVIYKNNNRIYVSSFKKYFSNNIIVEEKLRTIDLKKYSLIFRII